MQKKFLSFIISLSLVFGAVAPCFAVDLATPSAISLKYVSSVSDVRASGDTVAPVSSSYVGYYYTGSTISSFSGTLSSWGQIITNITDSLARSLQSVTLQIRPYIDQIENYVDGLEGLVGTSNNHLQAIRSSLNYNNGSIGSDVYNINENIHDIHEILTTSGGISVDVGDSFKYPWGYYNYYKTNKTVTLGRINENGNYYTQGVYTNNLDYFGMIQYWLVEHVKNMALGVTTITGNVKNSANSDVLTNTDLTTTALEHDSMWDDLDHIGANLSSHLARLAFVLASDEEIAARQAAQANQDAVVDDFISSSGSASASTSDFADIASAGSSMKSALNSNVSISNAFTAFDSSSSAWDWFSQATADSLDSTSNSRRKSSSDTPMLDSYYDQLMETLRFK